MNRKKSGRRRGREATCACVSFTQYCEEEGGFCFSAWRSVYAT